MKSIFNSIIFKVFFAFCIYNILCKPINAQSQYIYTTLDQKDGLSQPTIFCTFQDSKGFIWFGTEDGLNKYDGYEFHIFKKSQKNSNSISDNWIRDIIEDKRGNIWVATKQGVNVFSKEKQTFVRFFPNKENIEKETVDPEFGEVMRLFSDSRGDIWFGLWGGGIRKYTVEGDSFCSYSFDSIYQDPFRVMSILEDKDANLWIGTWGKGVYIFNVEKGFYKSYKQEDGLAGNKVRKIYQDAQENIWIGTQQGLSLFKEDNFKNFFIQEKQRGASIVTSIVEDLDSNIWVGTRNGLNKLIRPYYHIQKHPQVSGNDVRTLLVDESGVLWAGTIGRGITKISKKKFSFFKKDNRAKDISSNFIYSVYAQDTSIVWLGTKDGLNKIFLLNEDSLDIEQYFSSKEMQELAFSSWIWAIERDNDGYLWLGTHNSGLGKFDPITGKIIERYTNENSSLTSNYIRELLYCKDNNVLYVGTDGGGMCLFDLDSKSSINFSYNNKPNSIHYSRIWSLMKDSKGKIWVGSDGAGISIFHPDDQQFTKPASSVQSKLSQKSIWSMAEDANGNVWIGTNGDGLYKYEAKTKGITSYNEENSNMPNNTISGIIVDKQNDLWISTNLGIVHYNNKNKKISSYDLLSQGAQSNELVFGAHSYDHKNDIVYMGGIDGLVYYTPSSITIENKYNPPILITKFNLYDQSNLTEWGSKDTVITLLYSDYFFSFTFTSLDFTLPQKNKFKYKLEGVDPTWRTVSTNNRSASYTYISPGAYKFKVQGTNSDGIWSDSIAEVDIIIKPPFWRTSAFYTAITLFLVFLLLYIIYRIKREQRREREIKVKQMESREVERARLAREIHDGPIQDIYALNHRIDLQKYMNQPILYGNLRTDVNEIGDSLRKVCSELRSPLISTIEITHSITLLVEEYKKDYASLYFELDLEILHFKPNETLGTAIYRITQECLKNIIKHSKADKVRIVLKQLSNIVILTITDNGKGFDIPKDYLFFSKQKHYGILGIYEWAKYAEGNVDITSEHGEGTHVSVKFKIK